MGLLNTLVAVWTVNFQRRLRRWEACITLCLREHGLIAIGRDSIMDEADG
jgi:hypothetical protein